ncbi:MAG: sensor histidine kinase [Polyangiaceae bacterium]
MDQTYSPRTTPPHACSSPGANAESRTSYSSEQELLFLRAEVARAAEELCHWRELETEHRRAVTNLELSSSALHERIKELNCLYSISEIAERPGLTFDGAIQLIADAIPQAWQHPSVACARIVIDDASFTSVGFAPQGESQCQSINIGKQRIGFVEVRYLNPCPPSFEGPFLREERSLINAIASRLGEFVERRRARAAVLSSLEKNRALLAALPDLMVQMTTDGVLLEYHVGDYEELDTPLRSYLGRDLGELFGEPGLFAQLDASESRRSNGRAGDDAARILQRQVELGDQKRDFEIRIVTTSTRKLLGILRDVTQRRRLEREILEVSGREQRRIGRDLHDGLCQHLAGIGFLAQALARRIPNTEEALAKDAVELASLIGEAVALTKGLAKGLVPVRLETEGLQPALLELASNTSRIFGVDCQVEEPFSSIPRDDGAMLLHLYRIAQEALNNAIKHGRATAVTISIREDFPWACLTIRDNGQGFNVEERADTGLGLGIMRYRALMIGANLDVFSDVNRGTTVSCRFPAVR